MATRREAGVVKAAAVVQGIALVTFPAASGIFTSSSDYGLSSTAYGAMFVPQAVTAVASAAAGRRVGPAGRDPPRLPDRLDGESPLDVTPRRQLAARLPPRTGLRASPPRDHEPRRRVRLHRPGPEHVHRGVQPHQGRPVGARAQRAARTRYRARAAVRRRLRRSRVLVGVAGPDRSPRGRAPARERADYRSTPAPRTRTLGRRAGRVPASRRDSGSMPASRSPTGSARR